ncbi:MAG: glycosyltransferase [Chlamydiales bacterium]|nr:glycosyltransferase [Chlamydiales bacterium]
MKTPLVLFAFKRPDKLKKLLACLTKTPFSQAYIFCDGPRHEDDQVACQATQALAKKYAESYPIQVVISKQNLGLSKNLIEGISTVLEKHPRVIVFEDDVHPKPGCLDYLENALELYKERKDIFSIGCYHRPISLDSYQDNVLLSPRFNCWGWATWADRWQQIQQDMKQQKLPYRYFYQVPEIAGIDIPLRMRHHHLHGKTLTWDTLVALHCLKNNWWQLQPRDILIENVGFDGTGTNCGSTGGKDCFDSNYQQETYSKLSHSLQSDPTVIKAVEDSYADPKLTPFRRWRRKWQYRLQMLFK